MDEMTRYSLFCESEDPAVAVLRPSSDGQWCSYAAAMEIIDELRARLETVYSTAPIAWIHGLEHRFKPAGSGFACLVEFTHREHWTDEFWRPLIELPRKPT